MLLDWVMPKIRVLMVHNYYRIRGGEDVVFDDEFHALNENSNILVERVTFSSSNNLSKWNLLLLLIGFLYSPFSLRILRSKLLKFKPNIVHVHNIFPFFSPSIYFLCKRHNVKVVQTVHNFRFFSTLPSLKFKSLDAISRNKLVKFSDIFFKPYMNSTPLSGLLYIFIVFHSKLSRVFYTKVDKYLVMSNFARDVLVEYVGIDEKKVQLKYNIVDKEPSDNVIEPYFRNVSGKYSVFIGRLSEEKGIKLLIDSWPITKKIVFIGDFQGYEFLKDDKRFILLGSQPKKVVHQVLKYSDLLVFPSNVYETFGNVIVEAYSFGIPVLCGNLPSQNEHVVPGVTGELFDITSKVDFLSKLNLIGENKKIYSKKNIQGYFLKKYYKKNSSNSLYLLYKSL